MNNEVPPMFIHVAGLLASKVDTAVIGFDFYINYELNEHIWIITYKKSSIAVRNPALGYPITPQSSYAVDAIEFLRILQDCAYEAEYGESFYPFTAISPFEYNLYLSMWDYLFGAESTHFLRHTFSIITFTFTLGRPSERPLLTEQEVLAAVSKVESE